MNSLAKESGIIKPLMYLDINGILCSLTLNSGKDIDADSVIKCKSNNIKFIPRPKLDYFLSVIASQFNIALYTSRTE